MRLSFIAELVIFDNSSFHPAGESKGPVFKAELATELGLRCGLGGGFRLRQMATNTRMKKTLEAWKSSRIPASDAHFEDHEIHALTVEFLIGWRERNFGALAHFPSRQFGKRPTTPGQMAGQLRDVFEGFVLSEFLVTELENTAPAIWISKGEAIMNDSPGTFERRWIKEEADGSDGFGSKSALWRLVFCDPFTLWRRSE